MKQTPQVPPCGQGAGLGGEQSRWGSLMTLREMGPVSYCPGGGGGIPLETASRLRQLSLQTSVTMIGM